MRTAAALVAAILASAALASAVGTADAAKLSPADAATPPAADRPNPGAVAAPQTWSFTIDGTKRQALVFSPQNLVEGGPPVPVVFGFHGHGGKMQGMVNLMGFQKLWPQAVVIYPQGVPTPSKRDPQGAKNGWQQQSGTYGDRDLKFFDAMVTKVKASFNFDPKRIYVVGFSNGANFSYLLWGERAQEIAAFGIAAGAVYPPLTLSTPRSLIEMAGKTDPILPYADQMSTDKMVETLDGTGAGQACGKNCTRYDAPNGDRVTVVVHPGGHLYPTAQSARVVAFFEAHPLP